MKHILVVLFLKGKIIEYFLQSNLNERLSKWNGNTGWLNGLAKPKELFEFYLFFILFMLIFKNKLILELLSSIIAIVASYFFLFYIFI